MATNLIITTPHLRKMALERVIEALNEASTSHPKMDKDLFIGIGREVAVYEHPYVLGEKSYRLKNGRQWLKVPRVTESLGLCKRYLVPLVGDENRQPMDYVLHQVSGYMGETPFVEIGTRWVASHGATLELAFCRACAMAHLKLLTEKQPKTPTR